MTFQWNRKFCWSLHLSPCLFPLFPSAGCIAPLASWLSSFGLVRCKPGQHPSLCSSQAKTCAKVCRYARGQCSTEVKVQWSVNLCVAVCPSVCVSQTVWSQSSGVTVWAEMCSVYHVKAPDSTNRVKVLHIFLFLVKFFILNTECILYILQALVVFIACLPYVPLAVNISINIVLISTLYLLAISSRIYVVIYIYYFFHIYKNPLRLDPSAEICWVTISMFCSECTF